MTIVFLIFFRRILKIFAKSPLLFSPSVVSYKCGGDFLSKIISIDRIEGDVIVAEGENCQTLDLKKEDFADEVKVSCCYYLGEDGRYHKDTDETQRRKKRNIDLLKSLINKD